MDTKKCQALKTRLGPEFYGQVIPVAEFFDGNDDPGSIGCNLSLHPGIDVFRKVLTGLLRRPDVAAVYSIISELDPGEDCWPFSDTVLVIGKISVEELRRNRRLFAARRSENLRNGTYSASDFAAS